MFGYKAAFIINAASFTVSAWTVWLIPEEATRDRETSKRMSNLIPRRRRTTPSNQSNNIPAVGPRATFLAELREGLVYTVKNRFALTILIMNMIWATGGGNVNVIFERIGGVYFAANEGWNPDLAVALLWTATGLGLTIGMLVAHRTSVYLDRKNINYQFIGWTLVVHGILFATGGMMPSLSLFALIVLVSRAIVGVEYAVQETLFQRSLPDYIRGRISTLDRGAEMTVFGLSSLAAAEMMYYISPQTLTVISGILSALAGVVWFVREKSSGAKARA
jgi:Na+/melibiose symporter-like transporter